VNLRQLEVFLAVYDSGSLSGGAQQLHLSQSAVSRHIATLEERLGTLLFDRHARGITATPAAPVLADYTRRLFAVKSEAHAAIEELKTAGAGRLRVGASMTIGNYLLPPLLATFHHQHPELNIELSVANTDATQRALIAGDLDIGLTEGFVDVDSFDSQTFTDDALIPVAAADSALAQIEALQLRDLVSHPFVTREQGSGTRAVVEQWLAHRGLCLQPALTMGSTEAVKNAVLAQAGFTIISAQAVAEECRTGRLVELKPNHFFLHRPLHLLQPRHSHPTPIVASFIALLNEPAGPH